MNDIDPHAGDARTQSTADIERDDYRPAEYTVDHLKSDNPEWGERVDRLFNNTTITVPVTDGEGVLVECEHCGERNTVASRPERKTGNAKAHCSGCGPDGLGTWHSDHRVIGVKIPESERDDE